MTKQLEKKLGLTTETVRVLTDDELGSVGGGDSQDGSSVVMCISNGPHNDCRSVTGNCPTLPPLTTGKTKK